MKKIKFVLAVSIIMSSCKSFNKLSDSTENIDRNIAQSLSDSKKYFIVQNIATEKTRIYEKCVSSTSCANRLVFETNNVVGRHRKKTDLGVQQILSWVKFYQDNDEYYPSFFDPNFPKLPDAGSGFLKWTKNKVMPNKKGEMRGAFGWYAALMTPSNSGQWSHGTVGWGADGDKFITRAHTSFITVFTDLRSHGCVRHENRAVAYMQWLVPEGTTLIKIYAKEDLADKTLSQYENQKNPGLFNWILTNEQVRRKNPFTSEASAVQKRIDKGIIKESDVLERGSYDVDQYPTVQELTSRAAKSGQSGNSYNLNEDEFHGVFMVDEGRVVDYSHPESLDIDGLDSYKSHTGKVVPDYMIKN